MEDINLRMIVEELGIDVPILSSQIVGNWLELHLYGGEVVRWMLSSQAFRDEVHLPAQVEAARKALTTQDCAVGGETQAVPPPAAGTGSADDPQATPPSGEQAPHPALEMDAQTAPPNAARRRSQKKRGAA